MSPEATLPEILERAFDVSKLGSAIQEKMLTSRQRLAALVPLRGHLAKDGSLVVSYRSEVTDGHPAGPITLPLYLHITSLAASGEKRRQRSQRMTADSRLVPPLRRNFARLDDLTYLTAFPRDPELKQIAKLLRPGQALALFKRHLLLPGEEEATALTLSLLGHRPGRRAVFHARTVAASGAEGSHLLKVYRPHAVKRAWEVSIAVKGACERACCGVAWPKAHALQASLLRFPFIEGSTLHRLLERGEATDLQVKAAGRLLRRLHSVGSPIQGVERFTFAKEVDVLERWRRLFSVGGHPLHGQIAGLQAELAECEEKGAGPESLIHRDFYPKQVIIAPHSGKVTLIDVDTMALGPAAMDVGNFLAHLWLHQFDGAKRAQIKAWRRAFLRGYGRDALDPKSIARFESASLTRLMCLAAVSPGSDQTVPALLREARKISREYRN